MMLAKHILTAALLAGLFAGTPSMRADDTKNTHETAKPYPLDKCIVTDEKLGGHGKPYVFVYEGQEIQLCCKGCLKDFKKEPKVYLKKIEPAPKAN